MDSLEHSIPADGKGRPCRLFRLSRPPGSEYNAWVKMVTQENHVMEHELVDRAEVIQQRILQLRDSL